MHKVTIIAAVVFDPLSFSLHSPNLERERHVCSGLKPKTETPTPQFSSFHNLHAPIINQETQARIIIDQFGNREREMQHERDKGGGGGQEPDDVDPPDRRSKPAQQENQQHQPPQKCPRCDSVNTKFCYYNNYSLSQPRYFCKTCRRYWTQGGTLRNVPVGGGCRKMKRKPSAPVDNSRSQLPPPNISGPALRITEPSTLSPAPASASTLSSVNPYYPAGGFFRPLNQPQPFNHQPINVGGDFGGSDLAILQGFNVPSLGPQQHHRHPAEFYQMGNTNRDRNNIESLYASGEDLILPNRPTGHQNNWHQTYINPTPSDTSLWNIGGGGGTSSAATSSFNQTHWADLQGYGPPP